VATTPYAELHAHTNFSFLDGASAPDDLVEQAVARGLTALAATDRNGLYGAVRFMGAAEEAGLHGVVGTEIDLPYGQWNVASIAPAGVIDQVFVVAEESSEGGPGQRTAESRVRDNVRIPPTASSADCVPT